MHEFSSTLKKVPLFSDFSMEEVDEISSNFSLVKLSKDKVVLNINEQGKYLYIIKYGQVKIVVPNELDNTEEILATLGPGNYFGEMSLLTGEPISATVKTSLDCEFLVLDRETFTSVLKKYSKFTYNISMILSKRLRERNIIKQTNLLSEKVSVLCEFNDCISARICFLLGLALFNEGLDRVLIIDLKGIENTLLTEFGFVPAKEKLESFITTHDIGTDLRNVKGNLLEYEFINNILFGVRRKVNRTRQPYSDSAGDKYEYLPGLYILQMRGIDDKSILKEQIPPLLGLVAQIYDVVLLNINSESVILNSKALSQSDMAILFSEKNKESLYSLSKTLHNLSDQEDIKINNTKIGLFAVKKHEVISFADLNNIFNTKSIGISNLSMGKDTFEKLDVTSPRDLLEKQIFKRISRFAREITGKTVGLALGGGGARGYAHIGVLKVLESIGFPIDLISGSSMGALIGAVYCMTGSAVETEKILKSELADHGNIFDFTIPVNSFLKGNRIKKISENIFKDLKFSDMVVPFYVVCVDLITGQEVVISDGPIKIAVQASSAIPGIFKPVRWKDKYLVDGSVINKVPANILHKLKTDLIVSVNVTPDREEFMEKKAKNKSFFMNLSKKIPVLRDLLEEPSVLQIINRSLNITNTQMSKAGAQFTHYEIKPAIEKFDFLNFKNFYPVVSEGENAAKESIKDLKEILYR